MDNRESPQSRGVETRRGETMSNPTDRLRESKEVFSKAIAVASDADWSELRKLQATTVVDPTLVRVADLFGQGMSRAQKGSWAVLRTNLASLATFIDALVLEPGIPVFDYMYTGWDRAQVSPNEDKVVSPSVQVRGPGGGAYVLEHCAPVVRPVHVGPDVWGPLRTEVARAMGHAAQIPPRCSREIVADLASLGWTYMPDLVGDDHTHTHTAFAGDPSGEPLVNSYLYVTLVFASYAAQLQGTQILSPGQSKAVLLASIDPESAAEGRALDEAALFAELNDVMNRAPEGYPRSLMLDRPSFLPFILSKKNIKKPSEVFAHAMKLRNDAEVVDYGHWIREAHAELDRGELSAAKRRDIARATQSLKRRFEVSALKIGATVTAQPVPSVSPTFNLDLSRPRDWLLSVWPGKRYRRLLLKLAIAQEARLQLARELSRIWQAA